MMLGARAAALAAALAAGCSPALAAPSKFAEWTALVVAGDWRAGGGAPTETFDNARRDVAAALVSKGFDRSRVLEFSLRPPKPRDPPGLVVSAREAAGTFLEKAKAGRGGCLVYVTSHGAPQGAAFGDKVTLTPEMLDGLLDEGCAGRPSVAVISACYSGVFVPVVAAADRMVLTAARRDRRSFGCGVDDKYPYFDECVLEALPAAADFPALGRSVQACVARLEKERKASPPSEPQLSVGAALAADPERLRF